MAGKTVRPGRPAGDLSTSVEMPDITPGSQSATYTISAPGTYTLQPGLTRTQTAGVAVSVTGAAGAPVVEIKGSLIDTASGQRAINWGSAATGQLNIGANGLVQSLDADAVRFQTVNGAVNLTNLGQILSGTSITTISASATVPGSGYALNFNAAVGTAGAPASDVTSGGVITNGAVGNTAALIQSDSADAIRLGAHQTLVNYGTINGNGRVNDSSANNSFGGTSTAERYDSSRGVRINAATATNDRIDNYGTITAAQHGVDIGNAAATNILVNNYAGGRIVGRNGSGVGADTTGIAAGTVVVDNAGTISGGYAPQFDRAGLATLDGDGDGVDVDGGATVVNRAGGVIEGTGAGGFDSGGRANNSEGISIGGGSITNSGIIRGAAFGIVVNNDSNTDGSRSGQSATQIVNNAAGAIIGQNGYAIRFENKTGTAADNDTIVNYGTITGNGTVPDTSQTVRLQNAVADPRTIGTLDGRTYTAADAGSVRFVRGDGSAIQTGEGADTLSNYGRIVGNSGRALNLEGGDDVLSLFTGSSVTGRIDGGAGTDTLNLRLDDRTGTGEAGANSGVTTGTLANTVSFERLNVQGGTWTATDAESFANGVSVTGGALDLAAGATLSGATTVATGARLGGSGQAGAVSVQAGGVLTPGLSGIGTLATGNLALAAGSTLRLDIGAAGAADRVAVTGSVDVTGAILDLAALPAGATGTYTLIDNDGSDAVVGRFAGAAGGTLDQGAVFAAGGRVFRIDYAGNDGNDVVLNELSITGPGSGPAPAPIPTGVALAGTAGADLLTGGSGNDTLSGLSGNDTVFGNQGADLIQGNQGEDLLFGNQGNDTLFGGQGQDTLFGGQDADLLFGNLGADLLMGNLGTDTLFGGQGNDSLYGGQGDDVLFGDLGDDVLSGDLGNDVLRGGAGADRYVFNVNSGADVVLGFSAAEGDRLDLRGQTYTFGVAADGSGSALLVLSGGGTIELAGITQAQVNPGFFA